LGGNLEKIGDFALLRVKGRCAPLFRLHSVRGLQKKARNFVRQPFFFAKSERVEKLAIKICENLNKTLEKKNAICYNILERVRPRVRV